MTDQIEPFMIGVDGAALDDLHDRLRRVRWPERETVSDWSQGVPLGYLQDLCGYWADRYDWRATEARLNKIPQFTTRIDDLVLTAGQVLDNITLYWLTGTGASSARLPWESITEVTELFTTTSRDAITVPAGCSIFPKEVPRPSRRQAQRRFTNIVYWNEPGRGGHFAAWEQPALFIDEVRAVARSCHHPSPPT